MQEIAITIPLQRGGAEHIRALEQDPQGLSGGSADLLQASLWLHVTHTGQERAILYQRWDEQVTDKNDPPLHGWIVDAVKEASDPSFRLDEADAELVYSWDSPRFDGSQSYDMGACSLRLLPQTSGSVKETARVLQAISAYGSAFDEVGFRRIRNWLQPGPEQHSYLTIYNEALDLRAAFNAWQKTDVAVDQWTRNQARALSGEDEELWEDLLSVERVLSWRPQKTPP